MGSSPIFSSRSGGAVAPAGLMAGRGGLLAGRQAERGGQRLGQLIAAGAVLVLVVLGGTLVVLTAAYPSFMTPTANARYFPGWMAGPLGALWPRGPLSNSSAHAFVTAVLVGMYGAYVMAIALSGRLRAGWAITGILAIHLILVFAPPLQYTDVFNYINYGRMGAVHHLNPYATVPMLEPQNDPAFQLSNWHWLVSPYGPIFTLLTYALVPLGVAASFWALKVILCLASLTVVSLVWRCARVLGRDPVRAVVIVGLNPIVLVWGLGADHNDVLMVAPLTLALYLLVRARAEHRRSRSGPWAGRLCAEALAGVSLLVAAGVKASAAVLVPIAFAIAPARRAFAIGFALATAALGLISLLAFGLHLPGLSSQTNLVTGVGPANLIGWLLGQGGETDTLRTVLTVLAGGFVLGAAALSTRPGRDWIALAGASLFVVWVATSWFSPWYIVWILPFAALAERRRLSYVLLAFGVYILLVFGPEVTPFLHALHFEPFGSPIGRVHSALNSHLVR
jgi:hypothetical protein